MTIEELQDKLDTTINECSMCGGKELTESEARA